MNSLLLAMLLMLEVGGMTTVFTNNPFPVAVHYTQVAKASDVRIEIETDWRKVNPVEIAVINRDVVKLVDLKKIEINKQNRAVLKLKELFPDKYLSGVVPLIISIRSSNGVRAEIKNISVRVQ